MTDQKIPEVARINDLIPTIEKRAKIIVKDHLGKGALRPLKTMTDSWGKYYGELNASGKEHGRGISIRNDGFILIGYRENGELSTGNYISIWSDGRFNVGERYLMDGKIAVSNTWYYTDGTEEKYDRKIC